MSYKIEVSDDRKNILVYDGTREILSVKNTEFNWDMLQTISIIPKEEMRVNVQFPEVGVFARYRLLKELGEDYKHYIDPSIKDVSPYITNRRDSLEKDISDKELSELYDKKE